jgi:ribosomal protein S18 acetylase RimI-like enzyme
MHRGSAIALMVLPKLLKAAVWKRCLETLRYPFVIGSSTGSRAELLSVAVSDSARGHGIGKELIRAVDQQLGQLGVTEYAVVTYAPDVRSNGFYRAAGFNLAGSFVHHGKPMNRFVRILSSP